MINRRGNISGRVIWLVLVLGFSVGALSQNIRPLSKNFYRLPYLDSTVVNSHSVNHVFTNGHNGHDLFGSPYVGFPSPYTLVAAADGVVVQSIDAFNECSSTTGDCSNQIWIRHDNDEYTGYYHIAFGSALVDSGDAVVAGQPIATEGDVGLTFGTGPPNRPKLDCDGVQDPADTLFCSVHIHFAVSDTVSMDPNNTLLNPRICGDASSPLTLLPNENYGADENLPCNRGLCNEGLIHLGTWEDTIAVSQASESITSSSNIDNSVIGLQAGESILLVDGFHAFAGSYFRAEIGNCNSNPVLSTNRVETATASKGAIAMCEKKASAELDSALAAVPDNVDHANLESIPTEYSLSQNFPNPFNPTTTIRYALKESEYVKLIIYDMLGREVRALVENWEMAGYYQVVWDGRNNGGQSVASGNYIYRITAGNFKKTRQLTLLR